ncbi:response regulator [Pedobacter mendelii]|uniref:DNA-binding response regulator n=1 Tax=Pedobacter mendelii TaxID=1908240 RepID=A0ABQ2BM27_9SPHI|nr:response regulator transcription factor [Pedobacter mendelii]GGI29153.1 DNA-binding response regulator [Pedobacter mendelii]
MVKILIVDDHNMMIKGLKLILAVRKDFNVYATANNGLEAIDIIKKDKPDVILLDINMPLLNGYQTLQILKSDFPEVKIIVLSMSADRKSVLNMLEAGANSYLFKNTDDKTLFIAIDEVINGKYYVSNEIENVLEEFIIGQRDNSKKNSQKLLSLREIEIAKLIMDGNTNSEIADILFLSVRTVDTHRKNILYKLGLNNTATLVKYVMENKVFLGMD